MFLTENDQEAHERSQQRTTTRRHEMEAGANKATTPEMVKLVILEQLRFLYRNGDSRPTVYFILSTKNFLKWSDSTPPRNMLDGLRVYHAVHYEVSRLVREEVGAMFTIISQSDCLSQDRFAIGYEFVKKE